MAFTPALRVSASLVLAWAFATGCTITTNTAPSECSVDPNVPCAGNFVGYSCSGEAPPVSLSCGAGVTESNGEIGYCCGVQTQNVCVVDGSVGCTDGSSGYSCTGADTPSIADPSLACGASVAGPNGDLLYCCIGVTSSSCAADASVAGCTGGSYGFSCTSTDTPTQGNSALNCSEPTTAASGALLYCCVGFSASTSSCEADPSVAGCGGNSYGFSCTSTDTPDQAQTSLSCSTATAGPNGELLYCCSNN